MDKLTDAEIAELAELEHEEAMEEIIGRTRLSRGQAAVRAVRIASLRARYEEPHPTTPPVQR